MKLEKTNFKQSEKPRYKIDENVLTSAVQTLLQSDVFFLITIDNTDKKNPACFISHNVAPENKNMFDAGARMLSTTEIFKQLILNNTKL